MFRKYYFNVWCLDWSCIAAAPWYDYAAEGTCPAGHSLGAHVAGCCGSRVYEICGKKVARILGPFFQEYDTAGGLDSSDASYVQSIHCDCGMFGCDWRCGHSDFYMNGGNAQPFCSTGSDLTGCSHNACKKMAVDSIRNEGIYQSCECNNYDFNCAPNPTTATMGYHCSEEARGTQCIWSSYDPPFSV